MSSVRIDLRIVCNCLSFEGVFSLGNMWHASVADSFTRLNSTSGNVRCAVLHLFHSGEVDAFGSKRIPPKKRTLSGESCNNLFTFSRIFS